MHRHGKSWGTYLSPQGCQSGWEAVLQTAIQFLLLHTLHRFWLGYYLHHQLLTTSQQSIQSPLAAKWEPLNSACFLKMPQIVTCDLSYQRFVIRQKTEQYRPTRWMHGCRNLQSIKSINTKTSNVLYKHYWLPMPIPLSILASTKKECATSLRSSLLCPSVHMFTSAQTLPILTGSSLYPHWSALHSRPDFNSTHRNRNYVS